MPRYNRPGLVYFYNGNPLTDGALAFYDAGTNDIKTTYVDANETIANPHPVPLNADGVAPDIFFSGTAKLIIFGNGGVQVSEYDPVAATVGSSGDISQFNNDVPYALAANVAAINLDNIRFDVIDNPMCSILKRNKVVEVLSPGSVTSDLTATRTTAARYIDPYGISRLAAIDELRQEEKGWLIEGESENLFLQTDDYTTGWTAAQTGDGVASSSTAPISGLRSINAFASGGTAWIQSSAVAIAAGDYTISVKIEELIDIGSDSDILGFTVTDTVTMTITSYFAKASDAVNDIVKVSFNAANSSLIFAAVGIGIKFSSIQNESGNIICSSLQLEPGSVASSFMETGATSTTRGADLVNFSALNNSPNSNQTHTLLLTYNSLDTDMTINRRILGMTDISFYFLRLLTTGKLSLSDAESNTVGTSGTIAFINDMDLLERYFYTNGSKDPALDGGNYGNNAVAPTNYVLGNSAHSYSTTQAFYGHISNIRIYNKVLNVDELKYLNGA